MLNCTTGTMNSSHSSNSTPLTGMYIATATLVFAIAIIADLVEGLRSKQYWIPSGYTSLNSITLTILGAATKLSMDLSTTMPGQIDQLAKLGTSAFMCIALASIHPSLGKLENSELFSNTVSLSILVISSIANLLIQLRTGVIYTFKTTHVIMLTMMSLLLLHCVLSAAYLSLYKSIYQNNFQEQDQSARREWIDLTDDKHPQTENLKRYLKKFSMLAYASCPHFLLGRSSQGIPPTIYGLVAAVAFFVAWITPITHGHKFLGSTPSSSSSAYDWSVLWISMTQIIALGVGTIVLCVRGCHITTVYWKRMGSRSPTGFKWNPLPGYRHLMDYTVYSQHKGLFYKSKMILSSSFLAFFRTFPAVVSMLFFAIMDLFLLGIMLVGFRTTRRCTTYKLPHRPSQPEELASEEADQYISAMIGVENEGSVKWLMKSMLSVTKKHISTKERNTEHIEELLRKYLSADFRGVVSFGSDEKVTPVDLQGSPPNNWSLPVVVLTSIAITLPNVDQQSIDMLIKGVNEGLVLAKLIEDKFNNQPQHITVCCAAYAEWIDDFGPGCGKKVRKAFQNNNPIEILESIKASAEKDFRKYISGAANHRVKAYANSVVDAANDHMKALARSKYRLCESLLVEYRNVNEPTVQLSCEILFEKLSATIADILGACLTNLKHYILRECSKSSSVEKMREAAPTILTFFGDTEKIMEIIEAKEIPKLSMEKMVFIDDWREYYRCQSQSQLP